jgi:hypothetical protein
VTSLATDLTPTAFTVTPSYCIVNYNVIPGTTDGGNSCVNEKDTENMQDATVTIVCDNTWLPPPGEEVC